MSSNSAALISDELHPAVVKALDQSDLLQNLAAHFPDVYRIANEYAVLLSVQCGTDEICARLLGLLDRVVDGQQASGCVPSDTRLFSHFASAVTKDACAVMNAGDKPQTSTTGAERILPNSARRVLVRQKVAARA